MQELRRLFRFLMVGALNTGIGYAIILAGLYFGLDDYSANATGFAIGLPVSWLTHRVLTFQVDAPPSAREAGLYVGAVGIAYLANLAVLYTGRSLGYQESPVVQGLAICTYAAVMFILARLAVFRPVHPHRVPQDRTRS
jgi:putative flippase GtrA